VVKQHNNGTGEDLDRSRDPKHEERDMRLKYHRLIRPFVLAATAAMIATTVALAFSAGVGLAADYQDANSNVCEGTFTSPGCVQWGSHVTGFYNVAVGDRMMPFLTSGTGNVASGFFALDSNKTGSYNLATGYEALYANITGSHNIAFGAYALRENTTGNDNVASGAQALQRNTEGHDNLATGGFTLYHNTTGYNNLASGTEALWSNTTGINDVASGTNALALNTEGSSNIASGTVALYHNITGNDNVAFGTNALFNDTGSANVAIGSGAGGHLTIGSNNVDVANEGVAGESGTTRIGGEGSQTRAFVAGVYKKPITTPTCAVKVSSEGQLGCNSEENSTAIATFFNKKGVPSGDCLNDAENGAGGFGACPGATTGWSGNARLAGPTPANGATVTNLYADTNATVSGTDTVLVAVIDNTTGATLLSCTVNSTNKNTCSNSSGSGAAAAGDNIEVKLTATGPSGNAKLWRVRFRY
jgi:hypothetical protein